jgi:hypothetical protein
MEKTTIVVLVIVAIAIVIGIYFVFVYEFPATSSYIEQLCGRSKMTMYNEWMCYVDTPRTAP